MHTCSLLHRGEEWLTVAMICDTNYEQTLFVCTGKDHEVLWPLARSFSYPEGP